MNPRLTTFWRDRRYPASSVAGIVGVAIAGSTAFSVATCRWASNDVGHPKFAQRSLGTRCVYRQGGALPDPGCTPGVANRDVTQDTIGSTICVRGWTATVRPPQSVTGPMKRRSMREYDVGQLSAHDFEYDHLISLELGGSPADARNLWPEPHVVVGGHGSLAKDAVENRLKRAVCKGMITLAGAQEKIVGEWWR